MRLNLTPTKLLGFAMHCVLFTTRTKLTKLETIRVITTILLGGVIALFAVITLKRNDWTNIFLLGSHSILPTFSLFDNFGDDTGTDGQATFTDGKLRTLLQRHRHDQLHRQVHIITRHHHLHAFRQGDVASHIHRADIELRSVATEERLVPPPFLFFEDVHFRQELLVRRHAARLG